MTEPNTLTAEEQAAGFRLLFDGKTLQGWRGYGREDNFPQWRVVDGTLRFHPDPQPEWGHDIITADAFGSFELRIEWKLWQAGNSGILFHVREIADRPWKTGPEFQLLDNDGHPDAKNGPDRHAGAMYGLYPPRDAQPAPLGEWNDTRIVIEGDRGEHWLNGRKVVEYVIGSDDWNARVAATKFKDLPDFGQVRHGHLCLQDHRDPVAFRNIRIRAW